MQRATAHLLSGLVLTFTTTLAAEPRQHTTVDRSNLSGRTMKTGDLEWTHCRRSNDATESKQLREIRENAVVVAVRKAVPSVVSIEGMVTDAQGVTGKTKGSGFVIDRRGYVVSNHHVVDGLEFLTVVFSDGRRTTAKIVGSDPKIDIALLKVSPSDIAAEPLAAGKSKDVMLGESLIVIGNPHGYETSVSCGIASSLNREIEATNGIQKVMQTDAAINPGNSGGPWLNLNGEVVAMSVSMRKDSQGLGFGVPVDTIKKRVSEMLEAYELSQQQNPATDEDENVAPLPPDPLVAHRAPVAPSAAELFEAPPVPKVPTIGWR